MLPALLRRVHEAKVAGAPEVVIWGTGTPRREFLHVDDLADACLFVMNRYDDARPLNIGVGEDVTIRELAELIKDVVGFGGRAQVRREQTGRDAAEAARCVAADGDGVEGEDSAEAGGGGGVCVVSGVDGGL